MAQAVPSDAELIAQCVEGQSSSFRQLYQRYQGQVRATLHQLCGADGLDDLVQEVFLRTWRGLPRFRHSSQFSTWLYRITWNVAIDARRAKVKARSHLHLLPTLASPAPTNEAFGLTQLHYEDVIHRGLQTLSLEHRAVIVLHDLKDLPQQEVASILNIPVGTVKSRLHHARSTLRQFLQQTGIPL